MSESSLKKSRKRKPSVLDALGISIKQDSSRSFRVIASDKRVQMINERRQLTPELPKQLALKSCHNTDLTDLHKACRQGNVLDVQFLLNQDPSLAATPSTSSEDSFGKGGRTVHFATAGDQSKILEFLIVRGVQPSSKTERGVTPLHIACTKGLVDCAAILLRGGANMIERDSYGQTPMGILRQDCGDVVLRRARAQILTLYRRSRDSRSVSDRQVLSIADRVLYRDH